MQTHPNMDVTLCETWFCLYRASVPQSPVQTCGTTNSTHGQFKTFHAPAVSDTEKGLCAEKAPGWISFVLFWRLRVQWKARDFSALECSHRIKRISEFVLFVRHVFSLKTYLKQCILLLGFPRIDSALSNKSCNLVHFTRFWTFQCSGPCKKRGKSLQM